MSKKQKIKTKTIRVGHFDKRKLNRHLRAGWTVASTRGGALGTAQIITLTKVVGGEQNAE